MTAMRDYLTTVRERTVVFDGGMGATLEDFDLSLEKDYGLPGRAQADRAVAQGLVQLSRSGYASVREMMELLEERGILYAPDYCVNSGGLIQVADELREELAPVPAQPIASTAKSTGVSSPVGTLWSMVAIVRSGRRTPRPARRRPSNACGLVTSWTRWRSM